MSDETRIVKQAAAMISEDERGCFVHGDFFDLYGTFAGSREYGVVNILNKITQDLWNISTIIDRLDWMWHESLKNDYLRQRWSSFVAVDIEHFHIEMRSIMDYVAELFAESLPARSQTPKSFERLINWIDKNPGAVGSEKDDLVRSAIWFNDILVIRNHTIHWGARTAVFEGPEEGILFQVHGDDIRQWLAQQSSFTVYNENGVIYFDRYATLYVSHLLVFLKNLSQIPISVNHAPSSVGTTKNYSAGFCVIKGWMRKTIGILESREAA